MNRKFTRPTRNAVSPPFSVRHKLPMFSLGNVVATPGALDLLDRHALNAITILRRHMWGDFGTVCAEDHDANLAAIGNGARILSAYEVGPDGKNEKLWVITEADRSSTTLLLPSEY
jgi:hypothetical protein